MCTCLESRGFSERCKAGRAIETSGLGIQTQQYSPSYLFMRYESELVLPFYCMSSTKAIAFIPPVVLLLLTKAYSLLVLASGLD